MLNNQFSLKNTKLSFIPLILMHLGVIVTWPQAGDQNQPTRLYRANIGFYKILRYVGLIKARIAGRQYFRNMTTWGKYSYVFFCCACLLFCYHHVTFMWTVSFQNLLSYTRDRWLHTYFILTIWLRRLTLYHHILALLKLN